MKTIIEPFRIKSVEPLKFTTPAQREEFLKQAYAKHSYRWTPIGNMEHLKAAAVNELQNFFNTY